MFSCVFLLRSSSGHEEKIVPAGEKSTRKKKGNRKFLETYDRDGRLGTEISLKILGTEISLKRLGTER